MKLTDFKVGDKIRSIHWLPNTWFEIGFFDNDAYAWGMNTDGYVERWKSDYSIKWELWQEPKEKYFASCSDRLDGGVDISIMQYGMNDCSKKIILQFSYENLKKTMAILTPGPSMFVLLNDLLHEKTVEYLEVDGKKYDKFDIRMLLHELRK